MKKKLLIAGGSGFIGSHLIESLLSHKFTITSISLNKHKSFLRHKGVKYIYLDVSNYKNLEKKITKNFDIFINLSGHVDHHNKNKVIKSHYYGCRNLAELAVKRKVDTFIQVGSSSEYGKNKRAHSEKFVCKPNSFYSLAKYKSTKFLEAFTKKNEINFVTLRPYQIYGAGQEANRLIPFVIKSCLKNKKFACTDGTQFRDFLHINDFTRLIKKIILSKKTTSGVYNVGYGKPVSIKKVINLIYKTIGKGLPLYGLKKTRKDEALVSYPNILKIKKKFNWSPKINLEAGIKNTIKSYDSK